MSILSTNATIQLLAASEVSKSQGGRSATQLQGIVISDLWKNGLASLFQDYRASYHLLAPASIAFSREKSQTVGSQLAIQRNHPKKVYRKVDR
jgi:hypothetical protein